MEQIPYEQIVPEQTAQLARKVSSVPPDTPVPTCPEWDVTELAQHVGQTQLFFAAMIDDRASGPADFRWPEESIPPHQADWEAWLVGASTSLVNAVRSAGPDAAVWNPTGDPASGPAYWLRRAFGELAAHRFDASAAAAQPFDLRPELAAVAVSEFLEMVTSATWSMNMPDSAAGMRGSGQTLQWQATDIEQEEHPPAEWRITRDPDGPVLERRCAAADVTIKGSASALLPLLIRRTSIDQAEVSGVKISGDRSLLSDWLELMKY